MNEEDVIEFIKNEESEYFNSLDEERRTYVKSYKHLYRHVTLEALQNIFSYFHSEFNNLFGELNGGRNRINADPSRYYLEKLEQFRVLKTNLNESKFEFSVDEEYEKYLEICSKYIQPTQGSDFPNDFKRIGIVKVRPIFKIITKNEDKGNELFNDQGLELFRELIKKLYDKDEVLGKTFQSKVRYKSFENNVLTWETMLSDDEKKLLKNNWMDIRTFVHEIFGSEVKIKNIPVTDIDVRKNNQLNQVKDIERKSKNIKSKGIEMKYKFSDNKDEEIIYEFPYKNILLKGVPGTGKSRTLENIINEHLNLEEHYDTNVLRINIHSASSNADLMQGIAINSNSDGDIEYKEKQGLILELIERATFNPNQPFVLVLEEIQENSLNELIGDLIYLIEDSKRADGYKADNIPYTYSELIDEIMKQNSDIDSVKLPSLISKSEKIKRMIIPHNLFIFCTSNYRDDRKVIEDNLLRRFDVIEIYPKYKEDIGDDFKNDEVSQFLKDLNESIVKVCRDNGEIHPDRFMIGHSIWLEVEDKKAFNRAFLKVITEFKDVKDMHFDDFKKIIKEIKIFGLTISIENAGSYEVLINILQNDCYDFLK